MPRETQEFDDIELSAIQAGADLLLLITGGVRHIGAASTAFIDGGAVSAGTTAVPHHKEHTISEDIARRAAAALNCTVTVVMGIHYDHLSKEGIMQVVRTVNNKVDQYLAQQK
ncbi:prenylated flavin chaperone LpdD [Paenibacillus sp. FSL R7-0331]|uniref:prenylated flavin chaperone LpdD n=1 Tax=Paenibacillus sp. FSL R7-0331 TaxID=1536773 RepID=UPI0004F8F2E7|nr:hypothetical protein [Paenibacillus sp. FSL R7-0331]AIQ53032.1 hypothetical protein R70331_16895 [Paenibacillus sp. FSL R7-0331]